MRARLTERWPELTFYFGLKPWDVERLTLDEIRGYVALADELGRQARKGR